MTSSTRRDAIARDLSVYVASSSSSIERVRWAIDSLREIGIEVTCTWPDVIATVGDANPRDATRDQRRGWTEQDLVEVRAADVLWFIVPSPGTTRGAWFEAGYAHALGKVVLFSGDTLQSTFCAIGEEYDTDNDALARIALLAAGGQS